MRQRLARAIGPDYRWVVPQLLLLGAIAILTPLASRKRARCSRAMKIAAATMAVEASCIAALAKTDLDRAFTMSPTPVEDAALVDHGVYSLVRHPMYLSVILAVAAYTLFWNARATPPVLAATIAFLVAKIRHEERAMALQYDCEDYWERVPWRLVPRVW